MNNVKKSGLLATMMMAAVLAMTGNASAIVIQSHYEFGVTWAGGGSALEEFGEFYALVPNPPGETRIVCLPGALACAMASAHAEREEVSGVPKHLFNHYTQGAGWTSQPIIGGNAAMATSLGTNTCYFGPSSGCGNSWSDVASVCLAPITAKTTTTVAPLGASVSQAFDVGC